jgi:SAM-dependent methyltransferase
MIGFFHIPALDVLGIAITVLAIAIVAQPVVIHAKLGIKHARHQLSRWQDRVQWRFKGAGTHAFMFAWWKIRMDPMFLDLPVLLKTLPEPKVALDLGCGFGVAGNSILEWCPGATMYGIDPDGARAAAAAKSFSPRGTAFQGSAPDFEVPGLPARFDTAFCLDMIHFLTHDQAQTTFNRLHARLQPGGHLVLRSLVPPKDKGSWRWRTGSFVRRVKNEAAHHRDEAAIKQMLSDAGFTLLESKPTTGNMELVWFIART